jgi:hypothetical protein
MAPREKILFPLMPEHIGDTATEALEPGMSLAGRNPVFPARRHIGSNAMRVFKI